MRIMHVAWEYPPLIYGGLGRHVEALTRAQAARGDDVIVLSQSEDDRLTTEIIDGVRIIRAPHDPPHVPFSEETLLAWVLGMQTGMVRAAAAAGAGATDIVHAHDWVAAHAAIGLRDILPASALVATIHATEAGRHQGWLPGPLSDAIHSTEHWLVHQAQGVIVCSQHMRREIERLFDRPQERLSVIANGIDTVRWRASAERTSRARNAHGPHGPLVVFVGRLEWEKGAHTLIDALPRLRRAHPGLRAVIAGRGSREDVLVEQVRRRRLGRAVDFAGWLPEAELHALIAAADVLVVPSLYEPFGLVALEGAALGAPLVVARTGGLAEFVEDGATGRTFTPGDVADLTRVVTAAIADPSGSSRMARKARALLRDAYGWTVLADEVAQVYDRATRSARSGEIPAVRIPDRAVNLLHS